MLFKFLFRLVTHTLLGIALIGTIASADTITHDLKIVVTVVDPQVFHIVVYPVGDMPPPLSPFIAEQAMNGSHSRVNTTNRTTLCRTAAGTLEFKSNGSFSLAGANNRYVIRSGSIAKGNASIVLTFNHNAQDRFYGAGNENENVAGDLLHPFGNTIVKNGATRVPFLWSTGGYSILVANNQRGISWQNNQGSLIWTIDGPYADFYLTVARAPYALLKSYSRLTGKAPIPPRWTFGFMISRWGYANSADVQDKWHQFRNRRIPVDAFIYDYDWFVNDWDFNPVTFPPGSLREMKALGLHFVGIRKPRVTGKNLDYARSQGWVLSSPLGTDLRFDLPVPRYWWWSHHVPLVEAGVSGWWNDEAEQSPDEFFQMAKTEWDGWRAMTPQRAWSLNRAFAPGMQRFGAACWTGDIDSTWSALSNQPGTLLNWGLAGMPYVGQDIGGFQSTPTPELYARWIESGVFEPIMRAHGTYNSPRWPWAFGSDVLSAVTQAIQLRYRLIPYIYTLASQTEANGAPMMRPLFMEFPADARTYNMEDEWLLGTRVLAAPLLNAGGARTVYLPAGRWFQLADGAELLGGRSISVQAKLSDIPAYVKSGTILPLGPILQSTSLGIEDPMELRVYPGADAAFTLYEDDGQTYDYQKGASSRIPMKWDDRKRVLTVGARAGSFPTMLHLRHFVVVLPSGHRKSVVYRGQPVTVHF